MCSFGLVHEFCASKGSAGSLGPNRSGVFARDDRPAPATTFSSSVFAKTIRHSTPAFLRAVSYNRNRSTPTIRSRFRDDNCGANARHPRPRARSAIALANAPARPDFTRAVPSVIPSAVEESHHLNRDVSAHSASAQGKLA